MILKMMILVMIGLMPSACFMDKKDKGSGGSETTGDLVEDGESSEDAEGSKDKKKKGYRAVAGDFYLLEKGQKSWNSDSTEPQDWETLPDVKGRVLQTYDKKLSCKYYLKETVDGKAAYRDVGCKLSTISCEVDQETCEQDGLEAKNFGELFKQAYGSQTTCKRIVYTDPSNPETSARTLVETIRFVWRHRTALREDFVVSDTIKTCSLAMESGETKGQLNACTPPEGRSSSISLSNDLLVEQKRGPGLSSLKKAPSSQVNFSTGLDLSKLQKAALPSCVLDSDKLSISMAYQYCDDNKTQASSFSVGGLPKTETFETASGANAVTLSHAGGSLSNDNQGDCHVTIQLDRAARMLHGEGKCDADLNGTIDGSTASVSANTFSFDCHAPVGFEGISADDEEEIKDAETNAGTGTGGTGTGGTGTGGTGTGGTGTGGTGTGGTGTGGTGTGGTGTGGTGTGNDGSELSGAWTGFYIQDGLQYPMTINLSFSNGVVSGQGGDGVGTFGINGTYSENGAVQWVKQYVGAHSVSYNGVLTNSSMAGSWVLPGAAGTFQLNLSN